MKKCPKCKEWTLEFDEYFGRFRCFNPACTWMQISSAEREIRLLRSHKTPEPLNKTVIEELGFVVTAAYDSESDALLFDFGLNEPAFDLPEDDGRMIWKIGRHSNSVTGFTILGAKAFGVSHIDINIAARKEHIERGLKMFPGVLAAGRPTRIMIERITVEARSDELEASPSDQRIDDAFQEAITEFDRLPT